MLINEVFTWMCWLIYGGICVLSNLLIMYVVWKSPNMHTTTNYLIVNMALGDVLSSIWTVFGALFVLHSGQKWSGENFVLKLGFCRLGYCFYYVFMFCSVLTLVVITFDRFLAVTKPLSRKQCSSWAKTIIPGIWLVSIVIPLHYTVTKTTLCPNGEGLYLCTGLKSEFDAILIVFTGFVFPHIIIFGLYMAIAYKLYTRKVPGEQRGASASKQVAKKVTMMIACIFVAYEITWCPISFGYILPQMYFAEQPDSYLTVFAYKALMIANGVFNAMIYAIFNQNFRRAFLETLRCGRRGKDTRLSHTTSNGMQGSKQIAETKNS